MDSVLEGTVGSKAGMQGVDLDDVNDFIASMSSGTRYHASAERRRARTAARVAALLARLRSLPPDCPAARRRADAALERLEASRDLASVFLHIDMDAFYVAVEVMDEPSLRGKPVAVGSLDMLQTSSYEARRCGVRAGVPGFLALHLCPALEIVSPRMQRYKEISVCISRILAEHDPGHRMLSLDEASLNITRCVRELGRSPLDVAADIQERVRSLGLSCSVGVAPTDLLAKVCAEVRKPGGVFVLPSDREAVVDFCAPLLVSRVPGLGRGLLAKQLAALGVRTCGQIAVAREVLAQLFPERTLRSLLAVSLGVGSLAGGHGGSRKSVSRERTLRELYGEEGELQGHLRGLCEEVARELAAEGKAATAVTLKVKDADFETHNASRSLDRPSADATEIYEAALAMLRAHDERSVRTIGVKARPRNDRSMPEMSSAAQQPTRRAPRALTITRQVPTVPAPTAGSPQPAASPTSPAAPASPASACATPPTAAAPRADAPQAPAVELPSVPVGPFYVQWPPGAFVAGPAAAGPGCPGDVGGVPGDVASAYYTYPVVFAPMLAAPWGPHGAGGVGVHPAAAAGAMGPMGPVQWWPVAPWPAPYVDADSAGDAAAYETGEAEGCEGDGQGAREGDEGECPEEAEGEGALPAYVQAQQQASMYAYQQQYYRQLQALQAQQQYRGPLHPQQPQQFCPVLPADPQYLQAAYAQGYPLVQGPYVPQPLQQPPRQRQGHRPRGYHGGAQQQQQQSDAELLAEVEAEERAHQEYLRYAREKERAAQAKLAEAARQREAADVEACRQREAVEAEARRQREAAEAEARRKREGEAEARRQREAAEAEARRQRDAAEAEARRQREATAAAAAAKAAEEQARLKAQREEEERKRAAEEAELARREAEEAQRREEERKRAAREAEKLRRQNAREERERERQRRAEEEAAARKAQVEADHRLAEELARREAEEIAAEAARRAAAERFVPAVNPRGKEARKAKQQRKQAGAPAAVEAPASSSVAKALLLQQKAAKRHSGSAAAAAAAAAAAVAPSRTPEASQEAAAPSQAPRAGEGEAVPTGIDRETAEKIRRLVAESASPVRLSVLPVEFERRYGRALWHKPAHTTLAKEVAAIGGLEVSGAGGKACVALAAPKLDVEERCACTPRLVALARALVECGRHTEARARCAEALELDAECRPAAGLLARALCGLGRYSEAARAASRAGPLEDLDAAEAMVHVSQHEAAHTDAVSYASHVLDACAGDAVAPSRVRVLVLRAKSLAATGRTAEAIADLEAATRDRAAHGLDYPDALLELSRAYAAARRFQDARRTYKLLLAEDPANAGAQEGVAALPRGHYATLEVACDADAEQIRAAYIRMAQLWHPDKHSHASDEERAHAEAVFKSVSSAYNVLRSPERRRVYDAELVTGGSDGAGSQKAAAAHEGTRPARGPRAAYEDEIDPYELFRAMLGTGVLPSQQRGFPRPSPVQRW
eukprot:m51a1_g7229 putative dna polymerase kappa-like (1471) ;mRNA; r:28358-34336